MKITTTQFKQMIKEELTKAQEKRKKKLEKELDALHHE